MRLKIGTVDNVGPNTLRSVLRNTGAECVALDLAVAFVTLKGLSSVLHVLQRVANKGTVRFLTGLYQGFTEPSALRTLMRIERETGGKFAARISTNSHFHWKSYFLIKPSTAVVAIGSSNLTDDGLAKGGELNVVLSLPRSSMEFKAVHRPFDRHWASESQTLTNDAVLRYDHWRKRNCPPSRIPNVPISKILGKHSRKKSGLKVERDFVRDYVSGIMSKSTATLLAETTDWDRRGLEYMSTSKSRYKVNDRFILFDFYDVAIRVAEIVAITETPQRTADGKHFAAYRFLPNIPRRRLSKKRWTSLKDNGLIQGQSDSRSTKSLTEQRFNQFVANLNRRT